MTCIVGIANKGKVYIGGDSAGVSGWGLTIRKDEKVFTNGNFIFGFTSSFRMGQLIRHSFKPPEKPSHQSLDSYMVTTFIDGLRNCLKSGGFARKESESEQGGTFLVGTAGRLFKISDDYQVGEPACGFDACGCGENYALGALYATPKLEPSHRISGALAASEAFCAGVRSPFHVLSI